MTTLPSPTEQRGGARVYAGQAIEVHWEPRLCIHSGRCSQALRAVFDPDRRPWVDPDAADADSVARTVTSCPTGALHFRRLDGGPQEQPERETTAVPAPKGPLFLRGRIRIVDADGRLIREDTRVALCRCGASGNKPFCDGSHRRIGFDDAA